MSSKNRGFAAGLAGALDEASPPPQAPTRLGMGALTGRTNRLAELASGSMVSRAQELVDPTRCRMWAEHNRDYAKLDEARCGDLIESFKAQNRQEVAAIVRRVHDDPAVDFEVICGARRHWTVSWLRAHNYSDFRFFVEIRELTDEEAFRISDLENRAREDLSDVERARDYLRALERHYGGHQKAMAQRLNVSETWLSRYLDLARLPPNLLAAFFDPHELKIKHITQLKPLLKPAERELRVLQRAAELKARAGEGARFSPQEVIRQLAAAADPPKKSGSPKKSGKDAAVVCAPSGAPVLRIDGRRRKEVSLTLLIGGGATRAETEAALSAVLDAHWPAPGSEA
jgi:ParB family chromosome partitioning protein